MDHLKRVEVFLIDEENNPHLQWIIEGTLAIGSRPGYAPGFEMNVPLSVIEQWIGQVQKLGIRSIICLLGDDQLPLYHSALPNGLIHYYQEMGFGIAHIPTNDGLTVPFTVQQLDETWDAFCRLSEPVLIHCSAGHDRTGRVINELLSRIDQLSRD